MMRMIIFLIIGYFIYDIYDLYTYNSEGVSSTM